MGTRDGLPVDTVADSGGVRSTPQPESSAAIRFAVPDSAESGPEAGEGAERVTLQEAATRLSVGITTARRWVRSGRLRAIREETPQGHTWRVLLPPGAAAAAGAEHVPPPPDAASAPSDSPAVREVVRLEAHVADLRATVADLREQLSRKDDELVSRRREVQELHVLLGRAQLPRPVEVASGSESVVDSGETPEGTPGTDSAGAGAESGAQPRLSLPWWRRLLFG
jgi:excisionase family DNA binding protein